MIKSYLYTVVAGTIGAGEWNSDQTNPLYITGRFIGFQIRNSSFIGAPGSLSVETLNSQDGITKNDALFGLNPVTDTDFVDVFYQCVDTAGNAIAAQYDNRFVINSFINAYYLSGTDGDTFDLELLFDIEELASYMA